MQVGSNWYLVENWPGTHPSRTAEIDRDCEAHEGHRGGWSMPPRPLIGSMLQLM